MLDSTLLVAWKPLNDDYIVPCLYSNKGKPYGHSAVTSVTVNLRLENSHGPVRPERISEQIQNLVHDFQ